MQQKLVEMHGAEKRIVVLVDLLCYGIVALPIVYSLNFYERDVKCCKVQCHIEMPDAKEHSWLSRNSFAFVFSENGNGHMISFEGDANHNIYYHNMLNVVSDYLVFKEDFFA